MRVQREWGVVSRLNGSSFTGWGRDFGWSRVNNCGGSSGLAVGSRLESGSAEKSSTTDSSAHRRTPGRWEEK